MNDSDLQSSALDAAAHADNPFPPNVNEKAVRITHHYDIGNQDVFVERRTGDVDPKRAAIYCQFKAEECLGDREMMNLGIAAALIAFYGFVHCAECECPAVDLYKDREAFCGEGYAALMADESLHREGLGEFLQRFGH